MGDALHVILDILEKTVIQAALKTVKMVNAISSLVNVLSASMDIMVIHAKRSVQITVSIMNVM